ncbi:MAG: hypothetical protein IPK52_19720 [Chloroflexi bacterium]|nr:hypothetical protein [Chloroflexota bacterium]
MTGINQPQLIVDRLNEDIDTRKAVVTIFGPDDITRKYKDVPCVAQLLFRYHADALHCTVIMRSQNACILLPVNFYELSMLHEAIAVELGVSIGSVTWQANSFHIYLRHKNMVTTPSV